MGNASSINIDLSNQKLLEFPNNLSKDIEYLNISNNELSHIPSLRSYQMLLNINLTGNKLTALPLLPISITSIYGSRNRLFMNNLTHLGQLDRLVILDLSMNELE
jgi:hypothetical protein